MKTLQHYPSTGRVGAGLKPLTCKEFPRWDVVKTYVLTHLSSSKRKVLVTLEKRLKYTSISAIGSKTHSKSGGVRDGGHTSSQAEPSCLGLSNSTRSMAEWCAYLSWRPTETVCWGSQHFFQGKGSHKKLLLQLWRLRSASVLMQQVSERRKHTSWRLRTD